MKRFILFIIIFIAAHQCILQAEEIALSLDEAVSIALRDNRDILLKAEDVKKAKLKIAEAQAGLFPSLTFTGGWSDTMGYYGKDIGQTSTQTTLKQNLFKSGKIINTIKYSEYGLQASQAILDKTKQETALNVKKAFYALLLASEFAELNRGILENTQEHLLLMQARYENGQASETDLLKIEASLSNVKQADEASWHQVESAQALLNNLLYLDKEVKVKPAAKFKYEPQEIAYDEAFLKAMQTRPEIRQYEAQEQASKKAIEIAKADNRPTIYASWDYYTRSHTTGVSGLSKNWNDYSTIGLVFSWPIFDGWATKAKVEGAIVDLKEAQLSKEKVSQDIALELKNAYIELKNAIAKTKPTEAEVDLYKDTFLVTQDQYRSGIASSLDLNDVSLGYQVSLFNQKQAIYDYVLAKAKFDKATGGL